MARYLDWDSVDWGHLDQQLEYINDYLTKVEETGNRAPAFTTQQMGATIADLKRSVVALSHVTGVLYQHVREQQGPRPQDA